MQFRVFHNAPPEVAGVVIRDAEPPDLNGHPVITIKTREDEIVVLPLDVADQLRMNIGNVLTRLKILLN